MHRQVLLAAARQGAAQAHPSRERADPGAVGQAAPYRGVTVIEYSTAAAPKTVENFETLAKKGFYNGLTFHRVVPGFVVQGGDPTGDGSGGPGYDVPAEISPAEKHLRGSVAAARLGDAVNPDRKSSGSQFYICLEPQPGLHGQYPVFRGRIEGMGVGGKLQGGHHIE